MNNEIKGYINKLSSTDKEICDLLQKEIDANLKNAESKIWHGHPVWFLEGNPVVGFNKRKTGVALLFWSGQSFDEPLLQKEGSFKAAEIIYTNKDQVNISDLARMLKKSQEIQWDYKNIVKRKGKLERIK